MPTTGIAARELAEYAAHVAAEAAARRFTALLHRHAAVVEVPAAAYKRTD